MTSARAVAIHGAASSAQMWIDAGWPDLLDEHGLQTEFVALPGHVGSPLAADADPSEVLAHVDASAPRAELLMGFSAGATLALRAAAAQPDQYPRVVLLGIGDRMWTPRSGRSDFATRLRSGDGADVRLLRALAGSTGNDVESVAAFIAADPGPPPLETVARISSRVLIVLGAEDSTGPATQLAAALSEVRVATVPNVDHHRTPAAPATMMAVDEFLGAPAPSP